MGWNLKKKFKRAAKSVKKYAKKAIDVQAKLYTGGQYGVEEGTQAVQDITGKTAADEAERAATEQQALVAEQQAAIDAEQKKADDIADERKRRLSQRQLLSGTERGIVKKPGSLLGVS